MFDPRNKKLAQLLTDYSISLKKNDKVLIECSDPHGLPLTNEVYKAALLRGAYPYLLLGTEDLSYFFFKNANRKQLTAKPEIFDFMTDWLDKYIGIRAAKNERALSNIESRRLLVRQKAIREVMDKVLRKPWVITYYPTQAMAQTARFSLDELEDFYFKACLQDWSKIGSQLDKLKKIMDNAQKVEVIGKKTHLTFSLKGRLAKVCDGKYNMPDGEVYAAPLDGTMAGEIYFDFPSLRFGKEVKDIYLQFSKGVVVKSSASANSHYLKKALEIDAGAGRPGEFAFGANFNIKKFMLNTLFDEKIGGTIHLALGKAFEEKEGGGKNQSAIHWDLVKDMRKKGSQVIIDGKSVLKEGKILV
jgi:aminopeptidase